jgi:AcrR family transcriptional regulator
MSNSDAMELPAEDARRLRILEGAKLAFLAYGFQRTTMDDIARAAEISRPALYLMFRNKTDIYRALAGAFTNDMLSRARVTLSGEGTLAERLEKSFVCALVMAEEIEASPHGAEILDMKNSLASDIVADWREQMVQMVEAAIADGREQSGPVSARMLANMLLDSADGMKMRQLPVDEQRDAIAAFVQVVTDAAGR